MASSKEARPACGSRTGDAVDDGTMCRQVSTSPDTTGGAEGGASRTAFAWYAMAHARSVSYLMTVAGYTGAFSSLGGKFLRMYLDGKVDYDVIKEAGEQIAKSRKWAYLTELVQFAVQQQSIDEWKQFPAEKQVADTARNYLKQLKKDEGIAFRGELNPVIGGITLIGVTEARKDKFYAEFHQAKGDGVTSGRRQDYVIDVGLFDDYDFSNQRTGAYDNFRKQLAELLQRGEYGAFQAAYDMARVPFIKDLGYSQVFASYMYALEQAGFTKGSLSWNVIVPMRIFVVLP